MVIQKNSFQSLGIYRNIFIQGECDGTRRSPLDLGVRSQLSNVLEFPVRSTSLDMSILNCVQKTQLLDTLTTADIFYLVSSSYTALLQKDISSKTTANTCP